MISKVQIFVFKEFITLVLIFFCGFQLEASVFLKTFNSENTAVGYVKIEVPDKNLKVRSNSKGLAELDISKTGFYKVRFSQIGFSTLDTLLQVSRLSDTLDIQLTELNYSLDNIVVTGTKTAKEIESNPIPTDVVVTKQIEQQSSPRLTNILEDLAGMSIVQTPGKGVQTQGLNPEYTLILINGEPMIGRTRGILDLERFSVGNISRVEIVKGPSSSLYGSNALAGVINIITEVPNNILDSKISTRYASYNTVDLSADLSTNFSNEKLSANLYFNRYSTDGYNLVPANVTKTVPEIVDYTGRGELFYKISKSTEMKLSSRFNYNLQSSQYNEVQSKSLVNETIALYDINLGLNVRHNYSPTSTLTAKIFFTKYMNFTDDIFNSTGIKFLTSDVEEGLLKAEFQMNKVMGNEHMVTLGAGYDLESIIAQRVVGNFHSANLFYGYLQEDYTPAKAFNVIGSIRFDKHSEYEFSWNPKIAASYELFENLNLRASLGTGFKAPTSENLYLDWSNPQYGYYVYGTTFVKQAVQKMIQQGQMDSSQVFRDISNINISPEKSWSVDAGASYHISILDIKFNAYRNNLSDMIDLQPIGQKTNGNLVYTYINQSSVYTQGLETKLKFQLFSDLSIEIIYNYLSTGDNDVVKKIESGKILKMGSDGVLRTVKLSEYGGLFFRSAHSGSIRVFYTIPDWNLSLNLRGNYRSRYGFADLNSNQILDDDSEYIHGYSIWNFNFSKDILKYFIFQAGVDNIFNYSGLKLMNLSPGRTFYINLVFKYSQH